MIDSLTPTSCRRSALSAVLALSLWLLAGGGGNCVRAAEAGAEMSAAATAARKNFDIPAGDALTALKRFFAQSGDQLIYKTEALDGIRTKAVKGRFTAREALERMLKGTPLSVAQDEKSGVLAIVVAAGAQGTGGAANSTSPGDPSSKKKTK